MKTLLWVNSRLYEPKKEVSTFVKPINPEPLEVRDQCGSTVVKHSFMDSLITRGSVRDLFVTNTPNFRE